MKEHKMSKELALYENARQALSEVVRVDEVQDIRSKAAALAAYARQAKDRELVDKATEIKLRAERRAGELLASMKARGERRDRGRPAEDNSRSETTISEETEDKKTLEDLGLSKDQSSRWQALAALPPNKFEERVEEAKRHAVDSLDLTPSDRAAIKKERRAERERDLAEIQRVLPEEKFGVIYADPEWRFEPWSRESGMDRAADNHYPTSETDQIAMRAVPSISAKDCVLFLWATVPMLLDAFLVMEAWEFEYKSHVVWVKETVGTGYWFRNKHELLLIGTRGNIPAPAPGTQWFSVVEAESGEHSEKPEIFLTMIEEYYPNLPKIELNRRGPPRAGWSAWGNQVEESPAPSDGAEEIEGEQR